MLVVYWLFARLRMTSETPCWEGHALFIASVVAACSSEDYAAISSIWTTGPMCFGSSVSATASLYEGYVRVASLGVDPHDFAAGVLVCALRVSSLNTGSRLCSCALVQALGRLARGAYSCSSSRASPALPCVGGLLSQAALPICSLRRCQAGGISSEPRWAAVLLGLALLEPRPRQVVKLPLHVGSVFDEPAEALAV